MPVRSLLEADPGALGPEDIEAVAGAFEDILRDLGLANRDDEVTRMVAKLTIEFAKRGERGRAQLHERVMRAMKAGEVSGPK